MNKPIYYTLGFLFYAIPIGLLIWLIMTTTFAQTRYFATGLTPSINVSTTSTPITITAGGKINGAVSLTKNGNVLYTNSATGGASYYSFTHSETLGSTSTTFALACTGTCNTGEGQILGLIEITDSGDGLTDEDLKKLVIPIGLFILLAMLGLIRSLFKRK